MPKYFVSSESSKFNLDSPYELVRPHFFLGGEVNLHIPKDISKQVCFVELDLQNRSLESLLILKELSSRKNKRICAIVPYMPYSRQDRRDKPSDCLFSEHLANIICDTGLTDVVVIETHDKQAAKYFESRNVQYHHVPVFSYLVAEVMATHGKDIVLVAPDKGSAAAVEDVANTLSCQWTVMQKLRDDKGNVFRIEACSDVVHGARVLLIDDMIDTAGTIASAAELLYASGAVEVHVCAAHGLFSGQAIEKLRQANVSSVAVLNTTTSAAETAVANKTLVDLVDVSPLIIKTLGELVV